MAQISPSYSVASLVTLVGVATPNPPNTGAAAPENFINLTSPGDCIFAIRAFLCHLAVLPYFWPAARFLRILKIGGDEPAGRSTWFFAFWSCRCGQSSDEEAQLNRCQDYNGEQPVDNKLLHRENSLLILLDRLSV